MSLSHSPQVLEGLGVSPGVAIGRAVCIENEPVEVYRFPLPAESVDSEIERFANATQQAQAELAVTRSKASEQLGDELAAIFDAQSLVLADSSFLSRVETGFGKSGSMRNGPFTRLPMSWQLASRGSRTNGFRSGETICEM